MMGHLHVTITMNRVHASRSYIYIYIYIYISAQSFIKYWLESVTQQHTSSRACNKTLHAQSKNVNCNDNNSSTRNKRKIVIIRSPVKRGNKPAQHKNTYNIYVCIDPSMTVHLSWCTLKKYIRINVHHNAQYLH